MKRAVCGRTSASVIVQRRREQSKSIMIKNITARYRAQTRPRMENDSGEVERILRTPKFVVSFVKAFVVLSFRASGHARKFARNLRGMVGGAHLASLRTTQACVGTCVGPCAGRRAVFLIPRTALCVEPCVECLATSISTQSERWVLAGTSLRTGALCISHQLECAPWLPL